MEKRKLVFELVIALLAFVTIPLTAKGQSGIVFDPSIVDFGEVGVGASSTITVEICNEGGEQVQLQEFAISPLPSDFSYSWSPSPFDPYTLEPGASVPVDITFSPSVIGLAELTVFWVKIDADPGSAEVLLIGVGKDSQIEVVPSAIDFGDVALGSSSTETIIINSIGSQPLVLKDIVVEGDPGFAITSSPPMPWEVAPGEFVYVEVTFSPSVTGDQAALLTVESDSVGADDILLTGVGLPAELPPQGQISEILAFVDTSVGAGTLRGDGPGASASKRLNALTNMLEAVAELIEEGLYEEAYQQLLAAYRKTDGAGRPPDFVAGDAVSQLAEMIQSLLDSLE